MFIFSFLFRENERGALLHVHFFLFSFVKMNVRGIFPQTLEKNPQKRKAPNVIP